MQSALDDSLLDRAHKAASYAGPAEITARLRAAVVDARRRRRPGRLHLVRHPPDRTLRPGDPTLPLGEPEVAVATRRRRLERPHHHGRTAPATAWSPCPPRTGPGAGHRPVAGAAGAGARQARRGDAAVRRRRRGRRRHGRLGGGAQRPAPGPPAHHGRRGDRPHRGPDADADRGRRRDRPPGDGVQPDAGRARGLARPAAAAGRRRRPRAAYAAHLAAHQPRPALAGRRGGAAGSPRRPAPSCSTTSAPRSRS